MKDLTLFTGNELSKCITEMRSDQSPRTPIRKVPPTSKALCKEQTALRILAMLLTTREAGYSERNLAHLPVIQRPLWHQVQSVLIPHRGPNVPCLTLWACYYKEIHSQVAFSLAHVA